MVLVLLVMKSYYPKVQKISDEVTALKQYEIDTKNPICVIKTTKLEIKNTFIDDLKQLSEYIKILVIVDDENDISNPYMLIWRVVNNIDASRDIYIINNFIAIDATNKNKLDNFNRRWPDDVDCTKNVLIDLKARGINWTLIMIL